MKQFAFKFRFTSCSYHIIAANISNAISYATSKPFTIPVFCPIVDLKVKSFPAISSNGKVFISVGESLALELKISSGNFLTYELEYGDGSNDTVDHSSFVVPQLVNIFHTYSSPGIHTIIVLARNNISNAKSYLNIEVRKCGPPLVLINKSFFGSTIDFSVAENIVFKGTYSHHSKSCKDKSHIVLLKWQIIDTTGQELKSIGISNQSMDHLKVKAGTLTVGKYSIVLLTKWDYDEGSTDIPSYANFNILNENIKAVIINAKKMVIPFQAFLRGSYHVSIDGSRSFDPNDMLSLDSGINYSWYCRVLDISNQSASDNVTPHFRNDRYCNSSNKSKLKLSEDNLKPGASYELKMVVKKGDRKDSATIVIQDSNTETPFINIM